MPTLRAGAAAGAAAGATGGGAPPGRPEGPGIGGTGMGGPGTGGMGMGMGIGMGTADLISSSLHGRAGVAPWSGADELPWSAGTIGSGFRVLPMRFPSKDHHQTTTICISDLALSPK